MRAGIIPDILSVITLETVIKWELFLFPDNDHSLARNHVSGIGPEGEELLCNGAKCDLLAADNTITWARRAQGVRFSKPFLRNSDQLYMRKAPNAIILLWIKPFEPLLWAFVMLWLLVIVPVITLLLENKTVRDMCSSPCWYVAMLPCHLLTS